MPPPSTSTPPADPTFGRHLPIRTDLNCRSIALDWPVPVDLRFNGFPMRHPGLGVMIGARGRHESPAGSDHLPRIAENVVPVAIIGMRDSDNAVVLPALGIPDSSARNGWVAISCSSHFAALVPSQAGQPDVVCMRLTQSRNAMCQDISASRPAMFRYVCHSPRRKPRAMETIPSERTIRCQPIRPARKRNP